MPPSAEPIREQILAAVAVRLAAITAGSTYWATPGEVGRDWKNFDEPKGYPFYGVIEGVEEPDGEDNVDVHEVFTVLVIGWVKGEDRRTLVNRAIGDIKTAIYTDETWSALAIWTEAPSVVTDEAALVAKPFGYFELTMKVHYDRARAAV